MGATSGREEAAAAGRSQLLDIVVAAAGPRRGRAAVEELQELARNELDPAAKRRFLHALAMVENPALVQRRSGPLP